MMKKKIIISILAFIVGFTTIGSASWVIDVHDSFVPNKYRSGLTDYIDNQASGNTYIFDSGTSATYSEIKSDHTYDKYSRTIELGYTNKTLIIDHNTYFTHTNTNSINYSESQYLSEDSPFHAADSVPSNQYMTLGYYDENDEYITNDFYYSTTSAYKNSSKSRLDSYRQWVNGHHTFYKHFIGTTANDYVMAESTSRLYTIKLVGDVALAENTTLSIGAFIGNPSNGFVGPLIAGNFVELDLNGHTLTIPSNSTLNAYGYIIDSSLDENGKHRGKILNYGTIYSPFIVEDYTGGGSVVATGAFSTPPFSTYSIPYLSCKTVFYSGSYLKIPTSMYANSKFSKVVANLIGPTNSGALIELDSGSRVTKDGYNPINCLTKTEYGANYRCSYTIDGDVSIKTLRLDISFKVEFLVEISIDKIINMAEFGFVIPSYVDVFINSGTTSLSMLLSFSPGSTFYVAPSAAINLTTIELPASETLKDQLTTVYGGIRMLPYMTADSGSCYDGVTYGAGLSAYDNYRKEEARIGVAGNTEARAVIDGELTATNSANHEISGKINLSSKALNVLNTAPNINTFARDYDYYAYISGSDLVSNRTVSAIQSKAKEDGNACCAHYNILPLVSYGKVVNASKISSSLNSNTTYDYNEGIYYSGGKTYAYITNDTAGDVSGNIYEVTHDADNHQIIYNNKRYTFYRNIFVNNSDAVSDEIYALDNAYTGYSSGTYNKVDMANMTVDYTYKYTATGTTEIGDITSSSSRNRSKGIISGWKSWSYSNPSTLTDSDWSARKNIVWDYNSITNITTSGEATTGTFYDSTYNIDKSVEIISMSFNSGKDTSNYKELSLLSTTYRPGNHGKFSQENTDYYYSIGNIQMQYHIEAGSSTTSWLVNVNSAEDYYTTDSWNKQVQVIKANVSRSNVTMEEQTWTLTRPMYLKGNKSCLYWNATTLMWCKRQ